MKEQLKTTEQLVTEILLEVPSSRGNDNILFFEYFWRKYRIQTLGEICYTCHSNEFETARRMRQKVQAKNPFLLPSEPTRRRRRKAEEDYREGSKWLTF